MKESLRFKTISGVIWRFAERIGAQSVSFVVSIILARILSPNDYGLIALVTVFITISQVFVDSGFGSALIQKKDADELDFSSVFFFNLFICLVVYAVIFFVSPFIARFYHNDELTALLRVLSLTIVISSVKNVQQAYVSRKMIFKKFFFATLGGTVAAAAVGITMAYRGYGVWALVAQQLTNAAIDTVILWATVKWRPKMQFSFGRLKGLFSYGWKLLVSSLINTVYDNLRQLIIGKFFTSEDLAYFNRGKQIPNLIVVNINTSIDSALFPAMSKIQDSRENVKQITRRAIKTSIYVLAPILTGIAVTSKTIIHLLLTDKWLPAVPFLIVFCISYAFEPIHTANLSAIKAMGRSDLFLKLEIIKKSVGLVILIVSVHYGVLAIAVSLLIYNVIAQIINTAPNKKLLGYSYFEQLKDILPVLLICAVMAGIVYPLSLLNLPSIVTLLLQAAVGAGFYLGVSVLFKLDSLYYVTDIIKDVIKKNNTPAENNKDCH